MVPVGVCVVVVRSLGLILVVWMELLVLMDGGRVLDRLLLLRRRVVIASHVHVQATSDAVEMELAQCGGTLLGGVVRLGVRERDGR